jgi:hypothetical protein
VSNFVEECRREWKRLRVPGTIADEMAGDLAADLAEAEADGASAEDVLGSGASDPRGFAAAWASERGIVGRPQPPRLGGLRLLLAAVALCLAFGAVVFLLFAASSFSGSTGAPRNAAVTVPPRLAGQIIGTYIGGATVPPSGVALRSGHRTVLHRRPTAISISFGNSGAVTVDRVTLMLQIGRRRYERTATNVVPNSRRTVRFDLPANLPTRFTLRASTIPVPGETNVYNNHLSWKLRIPER